MITTIQIHEQIKMQLDKLKETGKETYEEVILNLLKHFEKQKRSQKNLLIEGYKETAEEILKITKEWETTDASLNEGL